MTKIQILNDKGEKGAKYTNEYIFTQNKKGYKVAYKRKSCHLIPQQH